MLDIYQSIEYVMSQSILSRENHEPFFVHLFHHIVYIIPHDQLLFFDHSILLFILSYLLYPWWSSSFKVDLPLFEALSSVMVSLTLGALDSCLLEWILNCHHLFFRTSLILIFLQEVFHDLSYNSNAPVAWLELFHKTYA